MLYTSMLTALFAITNVIASTVPRLDQVSTSAKDLLIVRPTTHVTDSNPNITNSYLHKEAALEHRTAPSPTPSAKLSIKPQPGGHIQHILRLIIKIEGQNWNLALRDCKDGHTMEKGEGLKGRLEKSCNMILGYWVFEELDDGAESSGAGSGRFEARASVTTKWPDCFQRAISWAGGPLPSEVEVVKSIE